jgi:capsule polysaccharide export protein KpsE/RkpR
MSKVERYYCGNGDGMFQDNKGSYVEYSDYKKLEQQLAEKDMQIDRLVVTSVGDNFTIDTMEAKIKELETVIDQQEEEIMDRNYFIAELSGEFKQKWATEEMKDKLINEGLKVKERIKELEDRLDKFRGIKE